MVVSEKKEMITKYAGELNIDDLGKYLILKINDKHCRCLITRIDSAFRLEIGASVCVTWHSTSPGLSHKMFDPLDPVEIEDLVNMPL